MLALILYIRQTYFCIRINASCSEINMQKEVVILLDEFTSDEKSEASNAMLGGGTVSDNNLSY